MEKKERWIQFSKYSDEGEKPCPGESIPIWSNGEILKGYIYDPDFNWNFPFRNKDSNMCLPDFYLDNS